MANTLVNLARVQSTTLGTGTLTLGPAIAGFNTFADAGLTNGQTVTYAIEDYSADNPATVVGREIGVGTFSTAGPTIARTTVYSSTSAGAKINCTGRQHVFITAAAEDLASFATDLTAHLNDTSDAHDASAISFTPAGNVAATDVQAAIAELDSEKLAVASNLSDLASASTARTNLGLGTAAVQNTGTSGANIPFLNGTNTWSAINEFSTTTSGIANVLVTCVNDDAVAGPFVTVYRNSTSPAVNDQLGTFSFDGKDSAGNYQNYALMRVLISNPTSASESAFFNFVTTQSGSFASRVRIGGGLYTTNATGGDLGAETINANTLYEGGTSLASKYQGLDSELTAIAGLTSAADRLPYFTGSGTASLATFTTAGRDLLDDADASAQRTTLGLGTAATQNTGTSGANIPLMNGGNTWSAAQIVSLSGSFASPMQLISTNADANEGPYLLFDRQSASPANNDRIGAFLWKCNDSAAANQTVGEIGFFMPTITAGSLASLMVFKTRVSGAYGDRFFMKGAFYANGSSDTGAGTLNAVTLYEGGTSLASKYGALAGTTAFTAAQTIRIDNAATNSVTVAQTLSHTTTGTPAAGIGVALNFEAETAAGNNEIGAQIAAVTTDVTSTSEDFDLVFSAMAAGAAVTERGRITSKGTYKHQSFTVAGLPAGTAGETCFASNGRKNGEGAGLGTGVLVFHDGTNWCACDTGAAVAA